MENHVHYEGTNTRTSNGILTMVLIAGAFVVALGGWWYQSSQLSTVRDELTRTQQKVDQVQGQMQTSAALSKTQMDETLTRLTQEVEKSRQEIASASRSARTVAKRQAGEVMTTLSAKNQELTQQIDQIKNEYAQKSAVDESLNGIKGDVGNVKTEVATTRTELSQTSSDLKRAIGDMGVMSGLIATNSKDLAALRRLGEKEYYEFTLPKNGQAQRVGDIQLALKKVDVKRNKYTVNVMADDKTVEKKDRHVNEPVQFYTGGGRAPYEVVVNEINKDQVKGYLAVPKVKEVARR